MEYQLREYDIKPGAYDDFIREWAQSVVPLRRRFGFAVVGAWSDGATRFVWIIAHENVAEGDRAYYASPERASLKPEISRHLSRIDTTLLRDVPVPPE